jgi:hypothetical protein
MSSRFFFLLSLLDACGDNGHMAKVGEVTEYQGFRVTSDI